MGSALQDKVIVVTGAGQGMARDVCLRLVDEGAKVLGCDIEPMPPRRR